jgi:hypothetical protein
LLYFTFSLNFGCLTVFFAFIIEIAFRVFIAPSRANLGGHLTGQTKSELRDLIVIKYAAAGDS